MNQAAAQGVPRGSDQPWGGLNKATNANTERGVTEFKQKGTGIDLDVSSDATNVFSPS